MHNTSKVTPKSIFLAKRYIFFPHTKKVIELFCVEKRSRIAKTKKTGIYSVAQDTIRPSIKPAQQYDQRWLSNFKTLRFTIDDKETGISLYHATIDGKWALFEYEPKKKELRFNFDEYFTLEGAKHSLEINVIDNVGNESTHQLEFFRK